MKQRKRFAKWFEDRYHYAPIWSEADKTFIGFANTFWEGWKAALEVKE